MYLINLIAVEVQLNAPTCDVPQSCRAIQSYNTELFANIHMPSPSVCVAFVTYGFLDDIMFSPIMKSVLFTQRYLCGIIKDRMSVWYY